MCVFEVERITILYLENNPLDRAVLDLHISQDPPGAKFELRYSNGGRLLEAKDILKPTGKPSGTMILFDLGLSDEEEKLLVDPVVRTRLGSPFLAKYLTYDVRTILPGDRLDNFKKSCPDEWAYIERIEGLRTLLNVRLAYPGILCGIVSHYVGDDIREVLNAFVVHGSHVDFAEYDPEAQPTPLVIHKGDLVGISRELKLTWDAWQVMRNEVYCKDVVQNSLVQAADGSVKCLAERVDLIQSKEELRPDDGQSPVFICDFLGLLDFDRATHTLHRLFRRVFRSLRVVKAKELSSMDQTGQCLFFDAEGRGPALTEAIESIRSAYYRQNLQQLVCIVPGRAGDEEKVAQVFRDLKVPNDFWYTIPSLPVVVSGAKDDTSALDRFLKEIVASACEYAVYELACQLKGGERFLADLQDWLKVLPKEAIPRTLATFWNYVCEVFEKQLQTQVEVKTLFGKKASEEHSRTNAQAELERLGF